MEWHPKTPIERGLYPSFQLDVRTRTCTEVENRSRTSSSVEARGGLAELAKLVILWELESFTNGGLQTSVVLQPCTWLSVSVASFILYCRVFQPTHHFQLYTDERLIARHRTRALQSSMIVMRFCRMQCRLLAKVTSQLRSRDGNLAPLCASQATCGIRATLRFAEAQAGRRSDTRLVNKAAVSALSLCRLE